MFYKKLTATLVGLLAVSLLSSVAQAKPVRVHATLPVKGDELGTVTISTLIIKAPELDDILILKDKYVVMFLEEMRRQGFRALGRENLALNQDASDDAQFVLGGTMTAVDCNDERRFTCGVSIDWQLLDKRSGAIVYQVTARHEEMELADLEKSAIGNQLLLGGLRSLLSRQKFVDALKTSSAAEATAPAVMPAPFAAGQVRACPVRTLSLPKQSDEALKATAVVKVNGGIGSAVVISPDGLLLTAAHVATSDSVIVRFKDGKEHPATVLRVDERTDIALLQLKDGTRDTPCLALRTDTPSTGEDVFALGAPGGERLSFSVTRGIVSGVRTMDGLSFIQTDTSISPGNSGGPLVDAKGQVVAIMTWKMTGVGTEGLGFGVPSASATSALSLTFGDSTGPLEAPRRTAPPAAIVGAGFVDTADPPWFYVGDDAPGRTPGWVGQTRGWGWVALTVGAVTVGTTALLNNDSTTPDGFRSLRTWNTVGWAVGGVGIGMVLSSYLFAPKPKPPSSARRALPSRRITAGIGAPGIGLTSIAVMGTF
jgi:S1-C subfamily serine protease